MRDGRDASLAIGSTPSGSTSQPEKGAKRSHITPRLRMHPHMCHKPFLKVESGGRSICLHDRRPRSLHPCTAGTHPGLFIFRAAYTSPAMLLVPFLAFGLLFGQRLTAHTITRTSCETKYGTRSVESAKTRNETIRVPSTAYAYTILLASMTTVTPSPITIITTRYTTVSATGAPPHEGHAGGPDGYEWTYEDGKYEWKHNIGRAAPERYPQHVNCE